MCNFLQLMGYSQRYYFTTINMQCNQGQEEVEYLHEFDHFDNQLPDFLRNRVMIDAFIIFF